MMHPEPSITVNVDLTNPGQFFACCGLLELANRLWPGAEGWFQQSQFCISCDGLLDQLLDRVTSASLEQIDSDDNMASPMLLPEPFHLTLDWWKDELAGGKQFKVWAGSMRSVRIARAMQRGISNVHEPRRLLDHAAVAYDPDQPKKKVEPFYFDSRRGGNAESIDIGFAPDSLSMTTSAFSSVEFLCLVGLQRFRPSKTPQRRVFTYFPWHMPLGVELAATAAHGDLLLTIELGYRFEVAFRTNQKKHKSFLSATPIGDIA